MQGWWEDTYMYEWKNLSYDSLLEARAFFTMKGYKYLFIRTNKKRGTVRVEIYMKHMHVSDAYRELNDAHKLITRAIGGVLVEV